jgi:diguanylate cyclase (GGDEF)-like protein/PAS domain S-box-containing protein
MASFFIAAVGSSFTVRGHGPFAISSSTSPLESAILLQLFLASAMVILYSVSVVIESLRVTERRLQEIAALHKLVTDNSRDIIMVVDLEGFPTYISPAVFDLTGWKPDETMGRAFADVAHPDDLPKVQALIAKLHDDTETAIIEYRIGKKSGGYVWVEGSFRIICDPTSGLASGILQVVRDITERRRIAQARELYDSLMRAIHEVTLDGILVVDRQGNIASLNRRFAEIWQFADSGVPGGAFDANNKFPDRDLLSRCVDRTKYPKAFIARVQELYADPDANDSCEVELKGDRTLERYTTGLRSDGGQYLGRVWFFRDITDRKLAEKKLQEAYRAVETLSVTDALTGLANRRRFDQCLTAEWRRGMRNRSPLSLLLIDIDLFKSYNDRYGHLSGDSCLTQIAEAAQTVVRRPGDLVARFGGEEFAIILPNTSNDGAIEVANQLCETLRGCKLPHEGNPLGTVTISIGSATVTPQLGQNSASLVELADQALYRAKGGGRNQVCASAPESFAPEKQKAVPIRSDLAHKAS